MNKPTNTPEPPSADLLTKAVNQERKIEEMYRERAELKADVERLREARDRTFAALVAAQDNATEFYQDRERLRAENAELVDRAIAAIDQLGSEYAREAKAINADIEAGGGRSGYMSVQVPSWVSEAKAAIRAALAKHAATPTLANHDKTE